MSTHADKLWPIVDRSNLTSDSSEQVENRIVKVTIALNIQSINTPFLFKEMVSTAVIIGKKFILVSKK